MGNDQEGYNALEKHLTILVIWVRVRLNVMTKAMFCLMTKTISLFNVWLQMVSQYPNQLNKDQMIEGLSIAMTL